MYIYLTCPARQHPTYHLVSDIASPTTWLSGGACTCTSLCRYLVFDVACLAMHALTAVLLFPCLAGQVHQGCGLPRRVPRAGAGVAVRADPDVRGSVSVEAIDLQAGLAIDQLNAGGCLLPESMGEATVLCVRIHRRLRRFPPPELLLNRSFLHMTCPAVFRLVHHRHCTIFPVPRGCIMRLRTTNHRNMNGQFSFTHAADEALSTQDLPGQTYSGLSPSLIAIFCTFVVTSGGAALVSGPGAGDMAGGTPAPRQLGLGTSALADRGTAGEQNYRCREKHV